MAGFPPARHPPATAAGLPPLKPREAYPLWAPLYETENALSALEDRIVRAATPAHAGRTLLDAGCGTGRRLPSGRSGPRLAVGIDLVPAMLRAGAVGPIAGRIACGDVRALPLRAGLFDVLWLRLVAGHLPRLEPAYAELGRVAARGARLIVSDFHPAAVAAGHARTFRDAAGQLHAVEHHVHPPAAHRRAAAAAGWVVERVVEAAAGEPERPYYARADRLEQLERERDLPLVLVMCFRR